MMTYEEKAALTQRLMAMLPDVREQLMAIPGVSRVAVGVRERGGEITEEFVFRVHVDEKLPESELPADQIVPSEIAGVPIDVVVKRMPVNEVGFDDENDRKDYSPKVGGSRIGAEVAGGTGTLGCFCRTSDDTVVFLSNWHVLIDPGGDIGDGVGHPKWRKSCCCTCGEIGEVLDYDEDLDCAIGELESGIAFAPKIRRILRADGTIELEGRIEGSAAPTVLDEVWKVGARTGLTRGMITDLDPGRVEISPLDPFPRMSNKGDSGSVYVSLATGMVCVLHNKGNGKEGFGIPFDEVMSQLDIDVIPTDPDVAYTVMDWVDSDLPVPVSSPYDELAERLRVTPYGRDLLRIAERHRDECLDLVESDRRFTVAWHRSGGPAYLAALARSVRDPDYRIPQRLDGLDRAEGARRIAVALRATASPELLADLDRVGPALERALAEADTVEQLLQKWEESRQLVG